MSATQTDKPTRSATQDSIAYATRMKINQIHPALDIAWRERLTEIFAEASPKERLAIQTEMLAPRGINWNPKSNAFHYSRDPISLKIFAEEKCHLKMRPFAKMCYDGTVMLREMDCALEISDLLEKFIEKINLYDVEEEVGLLESKRILREKFIYEAASIIKKKENIKIPQNARGLSVNVVKSFINEVYLKHQHLDDWFRVLRGRQLERMQHPFFNKILLEEHKLRKLEVVQTSQYVFAIATTHDESVDIYSIRRFLKEERIGKYLYLNCAIINGSRIGDAKSVQSFKKQAGCIVSVGGGISEALIDLVEEMGDHYEKRVDPLLFAPLEASNASLHDAVVKRLKKCEDALEAALLKPLKTGLTSLASTQEDFNYLFVSTQQILAELIVDFHDFQARPAIVGNLDADRFMIRLTSYMKIMKKRRKSLFVHMGSGEWDESHHRLQKVLIDLRDAMQKSLKKFGDLRTEREELEAAKDRKPTFFDKILNSAKKREERMGEIEKGLQLAQRALYMDVLNLVRKNKEILLHVQQESAMLSSRRRGYAFSVGENGVDALPVILALPENYHELDIDVVQEIFPKIKDFPPPKEEMED